MIGNPAIFIGICKYKVSHILLPDNMVLAAASSGVLV